MSSQKPATSETTRATRAKERIEVLFRKAKRINDSSTRYPGFKPSVATLKELSSVRKRARSAAIFSSSATSR